MSHPLDSLEVANYLVAYTDREAGEADFESEALEAGLLRPRLLSRHAAGEPLFAETIQAWDNGPVVREVYDAFKHLAYLAIPPPAGFDPDAYLPEDRELLNAILATYGQLSATRLRDMTHEEPPWRDAYRSGNRNEPISLDAISGFFRELVDAGRCGESWPNRPVWPTTAFQHQNRSWSSDRMEKHRESLARSSPRVSAQLNDPWVDDD